MKTLFYIFKMVMIGLIATPTIYAQEHFTCGIQEKMAAIYANHPEVRADQQELIESSKHYQTNRDGDRADVYRIPVVFHIIHENGSENISDEQIYNQMEILNNDFRKLNADTTDIVPEFIDIATDTQIEFQLANRDPFGNCTNGIEHIYSHETEKGDDNSKLNQWPRSRYLNIWVVKSMRDGVAGYSYYPAAVSGSLAFADGVIIRHEYIGSIGTGSVSNSRALTHEIGHWLGLPHVWGDSNSPEVACGDDDIEDTPVTAGHLSCSLIDTDNCTEDVVENVQNYMEYSYCSRMYTQGQANVMTTSLELPVSSRNTLHTETNHMNGGITDAPVECTPLPDFFVEDQLTCPGSSIQYFASVSRATVDTYSWYFPGGTPTYSTEASPIVSYDEPGIYDATLTVTNAAGSETATKTQFTHVLGDFWKYEGPYSENFENENFDTDGWYVFNPEGNDVEWELAEFAGKSGQNSIGLRYYKGALDPILDLNYYERQGGTRDVVVSPSYNLSNTSSALLSFEYIYATTNGGIHDQSDINLTLSYWKECASSWTTLKVLDADDLICIGHVGEAFIPNGGDEWNAVLINLPPGANGTNVRFKIEFTATDFMNNFFIDDFNVSGVLTNGPTDPFIDHVQLFPNPTNNSSSVNLSYFSSIEEDVTVTLYDLLGKQILSENIHSVVGMNTQQISLESTALASGIYNVVIKTESSTITIRLSIN